MSKNSLLDRMTNQQLAALSIDHDRWLAVQAGAGAGKTRVMATRFVLLLESGESLDSIVAITFTRKAARELASRIQAMITTRIAELADAKDAPSKEIHARLRKAEEQFHGNRIGTIDSFCRAQLSSNALDADVEPGFGQLDEVRTARRRAQFCTNIAREWSALATRRSELSDQEEIATAHAWHELNRWLTSFKIEKVIRLATMDRLGLESALASWNDFASDADGEAYLKEMRRISKEGVLSMVSEAFLQELDDVKSDALKVLDAATGDEKAQWAIELVDAVKDGSLNIDHCTMPRKGKTGKDFYTSLDGGAKRLTQIKNEVAKWFDLFALWETAEELSLDALRHFAYLRPKLAEAWRESLGAYLTFEDLKARLYTFVQSDKGRDAVANDIRWLMIDEFQDTDDIQWALFSRLLEVGKANLFIVGDDKQSIYRFRGAKVAVFRNARRVIASHNKAKKVTCWPKSPWDGSDLPRLNEKPKTELHDECAEGVVTLSANFRSLSAPLEFGNILFGNLFALQCAGDTPVRDREDIDPDPSPMDLGLVDEEAKGSVALLPLVEVDDLATDKSDKDEDKHSKGFLLPADNNEAHFVIEHIRDDLVAKRGFGYGQIAVLTRTQKQVSILASTLAENHIPFALTGGRGLYMAQESLEFWTLLTALATPSDNYSMTAFLRSGFGGISDQTLTLLVRDNEGRKLKSNFKSLWELLRKEEDWSSKIESHQRKRLQRLAALLGDACMRVGTLPFPELLQSTMIELGVFGQDSSTGAKQRFANLRALIDLARDWFEEFGNDLAAYAEDLRNAIDGDEEATVGEVDDSDAAVQLMTIHQSKGKEFDAVVLPFLSRKERVDYPAFEYSLELGAKYGMPGKSLVGFRLGDWHREFQDLPKTPRPIALNVLKMQDRAEALAEDRRLLYVAWTRAAKHLSVVMRVPKPKKSDKPGEVPDPESGGMLKDLCSGLGISTVAADFVEENREKTLAKLANQGFGEGFELGELRLATPTQIKDASAALDRIEMIHKLINGDTGIDVDASAYALAAPIATASPSPWWTLPPKEVEESEEFAYLKDASFGRVQRGENKLSAAERGILVHALLEEHIRGEHADALEVASTKVAHELGLPEEMMLGEAKLLAKEAEKGLALLRADGKPKREFTEVSLAYSDGAKVRSPRLDYLCEVSEGHWRIVDFKTGKKREEYAQQLEGYARALATRLETIGVSWTKIEGDLLFTAEGKVERLASWTPDDLAALAT